MSDQEITVKISADVKSLLQGMKDSQEATEKATAGMKGDLGSLIESFEHLGPAALAVGAAGLTFEALKESMEFVKDAVSETNKLARTFENLAFQIGVDYNELNKLNAAQLLTGGSAQELEHWMKSASRSIESNADYLVAQGIAADKATLMGMPFVDYLRQVMKVAEGIEKPLERAAFLKTAVGRAGLESAPQIRRFLEALKDAPEILEKYGRSIQKNNVEQMGRAETAAGTVSIAMKGLKQTISETFSDELAKGTTNLAKFITGINNSLPVVVAFGRGLHLFGHGIAPSEQWADHDAAPKSTGTTGHAETPEEYKKRIEAEKKAAEERLAIRRVTDTEIIRSADYVQSEQMKNDKELVASGAMTFAELEADMRANYKARLDTVMAALKDEEKANAGKPVELAATLAKEKQAQEKYSSELLEIGRQRSENDRKEAEKAKAEAEKAAKQRLDLAKIAATDELNLQKTILEEKDRALDQDLAFGRINEAQWIAMKKAGVTQELRAQLDALDLEQAAAKDDLVKWTKIQAQKDALNRKTYLDLGKLDTDLVNASKARWDGFFHSMTSGFDSSIKGLINGTMTWGDAFKNVLNQALDGLINYFVQWGEQEAVKWATSLAMGETGRVTEAEGAAAVYAVNAMGSVAAIPFYGWAMAPEVGATAYAEGLSMAGMASAAGGWERVPADQVAMIHKNEMVLPANIAEPVRQMAARGGGGGDVHFHGTTAGGFFIAHQSELIAALKKAGRNGKF